MGSQKILYSFLLFSTLLTTQVLAWSQNQNQQEQLAPLEIGEGDDLTRDKRDAEIQADSSSCGGVLESGTTGSITYLQPLGSKTACVWTIYVPKSTTIRLNVTSTYFVGDKDVFQYGYFENSNYHKEGDFTWKSFNKAALKESVNVPGPLVYIHLATVQESASLGFSLLYFNGNGTTNNAMVYFQRHQSAPSGIVTYDPQYLPIDGRLRYSYVVKPGSISSDPHLKALYVIRRKLNGGNSEACTGNETESLNVYGWDSSWKKVKDFCGTEPKTEDGVLFSSDEDRNDPLIVTFTSDVNRTQSQFEFFWNIHSGATSAAFSKLALFFSPLLVFSLTKSFSL